MFKSQILPFKRRVYQEFSKVIFLSFPPQLQSLFFSQTLELSISISTYRSVIVRVFLGDQSVVITKDLALYLRRQTCEFTMFRVLVRALCRGVARQACALAVCSSCGNKRGVRESKSSSGNSL